MTEPQIRAHLSARKRSDAAAGWAKFKMDSATVIIGGFVVFCMLWAVVS